MKVYTKESVVRKCIGIPESELGSGHAYMCHEMEVEVWIRQPQIIVILVN